jgi:hypothetical protein
MLQRKPQAKAQHLPTQQQQQQQQWTRGRQEAQPLWVRAYQAYLLLPLLHRQR